MFCFFFKHYAPVFQLMGLYICVYEAPPITAVVPADVLTLVGTALPGQKLLTLGPVMDKKSFLQPTTGQSQIPSVFSGD